MTWERMSRDNFYCAQLLLDREDERLMRSCVARSYYAAYAAACSLVCEPVKTFRHGWHNPPHEDIPSLLGQVAGLSEDEKRRAKRGLRVLREARTDADYRNGRTVGRKEALEMLRESAAVLKRLGVWT